ncbi:MAG: sugar transferase [Methylocapsa sp.]|nr:sugar transferase [Methylocapsa sp.]
MLVNNGVTSAASIANWTPHLFFTLVAASVVLPSLQTYRSIWRYTGLKDCLRVTAATGGIVVSAEALRILFGRYQGSGFALLILQALMVLFFLVGSRILVRLSSAARAQSAQRKAAATAADSETIIIVGLGEMTDLCLRFLAHFYPHPIRIGGLLGDSDRLIGRSVHGYPIIGTQEQTAGALYNLETHGVAVGRIVVTTPFQGLSLRARIALQEIKKSKKVEVEFLADRIGAGPPGIGKVLSSGAGTNGIPESSRGAEGLAALTRRPYLRVKAVLEPVVALGVLIVFMPLFAIVAFLTVISVGTPLTFWQRRPGLNGRKFNLYKFRTMAPAYTMDGQAVSEDERTSSIGHFMRRTRLDELPQLFNIVFGEMSFIGPRPLLPVDQPASCAARLLVRPGLTGWAQVKGGRDISFADKVALDVWYVRNASIFLDLKILALTVRMIIFGEKVDKDAIRLARIEGRAVA